MTPPDESSLKEGEAERLFAVLLEQYHENEGSTDPERFFASHPDHATTLRRWWQRLEAAGEVGADQRADRFGPFVLLGQIGAGAQGRVHLAEDTRDGQLVALKILPLHRAVRDLALSRFQREAKVAARLKHPSICEVHEFGAIEGAAYISMQYVEGKTLTSHLDHARQSKDLLPVSDVLTLIRDLAGALHSAHEHGLVHRDVKPSNVMVTEDGRPIVLDFGLVHDADDSDDLTRTGDILGTPAYMSPEQIQAGRGAVDARADVWALGVILYECLTLRRPFEAATQEQLHRRVLRSRPPDPRTYRMALGLDVTLLLETALAKDRDHRYSTAKALADDIERLLQGQSILARPPGPVRRLVSWSRRSPTVAASLALFIVSLIGGSIASLALYLRAEEARSEYTQLADLERLSAAVDEAQQLQTVTPRIADTLADWLRRHAALAERLPTHRDALVRLRRRASNVTRSTAIGRPGDRRALRSMGNDRRQMTRALSTIDRPLLRAIYEAHIATLNARIQQLGVEVELRDYEFQEAEDRFLHRQLTALVEQLEEFVEPGGLLEDMEQRHRWATSVVDRTVGDHRDAWGRAAADVAADKRFGGRTLSPQIGLVPLGPDPDSRLQEFAFLRGGERPVRDPETQRLVIDVESAPVFVLLPPGRFLAGAHRAPAEPGHDSMARAEDGPPTEVELDWFFISKYELTRAQWTRLGGDPGPWSRTTSIIADGALIHPVADMSWQQGMNILSRHELLYPTEMQWEYAARAGTTTAFWTGPDVHSLQGAGNFHADEWEDGFLATAPVSTLRPNPFGLHHVCGNVAEYCREYWAPTAFVKNEIRGGDGRFEVSVSNHRSARGGSFYSLPISGRSGARGKRPAFSRQLDTGVRPIRAVNAP